MSESMAEFRREAARRDLWGGSFFRRGFVLPGAALGFLVEAGTLKRCLACDARMAPRRLRPAEVLECPSCGAWFMGALTSLPQNVDPKARWVPERSRVVPSARGAGSVEGSGDGGRPGDDSR